MPAFRGWLLEPMAVSYGQVLGAGVTLIVLLWMVATLALWLYELGQQVKSLRSIEHHQLRTIDRIGSELHLCKRTLGRQRPLRAPRLD